MAKNGGGALFSYKDQDGVDVVVDRIEDVPEQYRAKMKIMSLDGTSAEVKAPTKAEVKAVAQAAERHASASGMEPTSLAVGALGGVTVGLLAGLLLGKVGGGRKVVGGLVMLLVMALGLTAYTSYLRDRSGLGAGISSPASIVTDTQDARRLMERRQLDQQKVLEAIEASEK